MRLALIAAIPIVIVAISPQRVAFSLAVAAIYVGATLILARPSRADRALLLYVVVVTAFMALSLVRADLLDHLSDTQRTYGASKVFYLVVVLVPIAVAVSLLLPDPASIRPAAWAQLIGGVGVAIATVGLQGERIFGDSRYADQGNLIALGLVVLVQLWLVRRLWLAAILGVVAVDGIMLAGARQSLAIVLGGLAASAAFWFAASLRRSGDSPRRLGIARPTVVLSAGLLVLQTGWLYFTLHPLFGKSITSISGSGVSNPCHCVTDRLVVIANDPGGRDILLKKGMELFTSHPLFGAGIGSFVGLLPKYRYPHNVPLEVAAELGLIGVLVLFAPLLWAWIRLGVEALRSKDSAIATLLAMVFGYLVIANLSGDIPSARGLWIFGILALKFGFRGIRDGAAVSPPASVVK